MSDDLLPKPPRGCRTSVAHERAITALAEKLEAKALSFLESDNAMLASRAKELALAAVRYRKQASEIARWREGEFNVERRHRERVELERGPGRAPGREPLRRRS